MSDQEVPVHFLQYQIFVLFHILFNVIIFIGKPYSKTFENTATYGY